MFISSAFSFLWLKIMCLQSRSVPPESSGSGSNPSICLSQFQPSSATPNLLFFFPMPSYREHVPHPAPLLSLLLSYCQLTLLPVLEQLELMFSYLGSFHCSCWYTYTIKSVDAEAQVVPGFILGQELELEINTLSRCFAYMSYLKQINYVLKEN